MYKLQTILFYAAVLVLLSCKKENGKQGTPAPADKKHIITFNAGGFTQQTGDIGGKAAAREGQPLRRYVKYLYYYLLGQPSDVEPIIKEIVQDSSMPNFGTIRDTVAPGNYTITILGTNQRINVSGGVTSSPAVAFGMPVLDAFDKSFTLTVDGPVTRDVRLERITAKLEFVFKDAIPLNAKRFYASLARVDNVIELFTGESVNGSPDRATFVYDFKESEKGRTGVKISTYIIVTRPFTSEDGIYMSYLDDAGNTIVSRVVPNIAYKNNKTTILTGYMFDPIGSIGVSPVIGNTSWSTDSIKYNF